jgi:hypothetical protein
VVFDLPGRRDDRRGARIHEYEDKGSAVDPGELALTDREITNERHQDNFDERGCAYSRRPSRASGQPMR